MHLSFIQNVPYTVWSRVCETKPSCHHVISPLFSTLWWTDRVTDEQWNNMYNNLKVYKFSEQQLCIPSIDVDLGRGNSEYGIYDSDAHI